VWLRSDPAVLAGRVGGADHRPLLAADPEGVLRAMATDRAPRYREVADDVVDVDVLTAAEAAERVLAAVGVSP
jgi:shikimate kinase